MPSIYAAAQERIEADIAELDAQFQPYFALLREWLSSPFAGMPVAQVLSSGALGTLYQNGSVQQIESARSVYRSAWPKTRGEALIYRRTSARINILPTVPGKDRAARLKNEGMTHFMLSRFRDLERQKAEGMGGFSWEHQHASLSTWTGKAPYQVRVWPGQDGYLRVSCPFIDPLALMHDIDTQPWEQHRVVTYRSVPWADLEQTLAKLTQGRANMYIQPTQESKDQKNGHALVADYWRRSTAANGKSRLTHAFMVEGGRSSQGQQQWQPVRDVVEWDDHGYRKLPIVVPARPDATLHFQDPKQLAGGGALSGLQARTLRHAVPFYAAALDELKFLNGLESLRADDAALAAALILMHRGGLPHDKTENDVKPGVNILEMVEGEELELLNNIASGRISLDAAITSRYQRLSDHFPDSLVNYQGSAGEAGYAINSKIENAELYMVPWTHLDEISGELLIQSIVDQHRHAWKDKKFKLSGIMPEGSGRFQGEFGVADYPSGEFEVDIQRPAEIPGKRLETQNLIKTDLELGLISPRQAMVLRGDPEPERTLEEIEQAQYEASLEVTNWRNIERFGVELDVRREAARKLPKGSAQSIAARVAVAGMEQYLAARKAQFSAAPPTGYTDPVQPSNPVQEVLPAQQTANNPNFASLATKQPSTGTTGRPRAAGVK